jgi:hypothetical protein
MTEYTSSPEAISEYMTSRERTAVWVRSHAPIHSQFYSPSVEPSVLDDAGIPSAPASVVESTHSMPPKMVLKYTDGRPDVPISDYNATTKGHAADSTGRFQTLPYQRSGRSRSHGATEIGRNVSVRHNELRDNHALGSPTPEEIRVWPSPETSPPLPSQHVPRSKSLPRNAYSHENPQPPPLPTPSHAQLQQGRFAPSSHHSHASSTPTHQVTFSQSQPIAWHSLPSPPKSTFAAHPSQKVSSHAPPAIVYAPSHHSKPHYVPPVMYPHYPPPNAPGMTYSRSAPVRYATPYPSAHATSTILSSVHEEERSRSKSSAHDRSFAAAAAEHDESSETDSRGSGSTYYVIPSARQKVHIIVS